MPSRTSRFRRHTDRGTIAAAGSAIGNATAIVNQFQTVTGADDTKGVILPTPTAATLGDEYIVYSSQATNGLKVFPHVNGTINDGSANAAVVIEGKSAARFVAYDTTNWVAIYTANA